MFIVIAILFCVLNSNQPSDKVPANAISILQYICYAISYILIIAIILHTKSFLNCYIGAGAGLTALAITNTIPNHSLGVLNLALFVFSLIMCVIYY